VIETTNDFEHIDIFDKLLALNPKYVSANQLSNPYTARINDIYFSEANRSLYLIFADTYVFTSRDGFDSLEEIKEINYHASDLIPQSQQSIDAVVETMEGTVLLAGRDRRENSSPGTVYRSDGEAGVVWRKPQGSVQFTRSEVIYPCWMTSKSSNITAGFFGLQHAKMVALGVYDMSDARFYYSLDDGLSWRKHSVADSFANHVHELYLPKSVCVGRKARLWVTGGDDPSGERSGVIRFDELREDGSLAGLRPVFKEFPGYRLVAINGNGRHVFIGNESLAGGLLKIQDNQESIDHGDFEYVLGKNRHDYHQFRALLATADGLVISGSSSFGFVGDNVRADSGGYLYVSNNEGMTFLEIPTTTRWITTIAYDGEFFWFAGTASRETSADVAQHRFRIYKLRRPSPYADLTPAYVSKVLILDSSEFYEYAGYNTHPRATLGPGERTARVDMTSYRTVVLAVETYEQGSLALEAAPFYNWRLEANPWHDGLHMTFAGPERKEILLPELLLHNRYFRVRNAGDGPISIKFLAFIGKR
jgi:hypothetical protein